MDLQRFGYHSQPTVLVLTFNEGLDPTTASNTANYRIVPVGPHGKFGHSIAINRVAYNPAARTVTLHPSRRLNVHDRFELIVNGTSAHADRRSRAPGPGRGQDRQGGERLRRPDRLVGDRRAVARRRAVREGVGKLVASGVVGQRVPAGDRPPAFVGPAAHHDASSKHPFGPCSGSRQDRDASRRQPSAPSRSSRSSGGRSHHFEEITIMGRIQLRQCVASGFPGPEDASRPHAGRRGRRRPLPLEQLEDRVMLSVSVLNVPQWSGSRAGADHGHQQPLPPPWRPPGRGDQPGRHRPQ